MNDFPHLQRALGESRLGLGAVWMIERLRATWEDSRVAAVARAAAVRILALPPEDRVRHVAFALGTAAAGYLALLGVTPSYVAPALPRAWIAAGALAAFAVAAGARAVTSAWPESNLAAAWRAAIGRLRRERGDR